MIGHDYEGMQIIMPQMTGVVPDRFNDHVSQGRLTQIERTCAGFIQKSIQDGERFAGRQCTPGEPAMPREAPVQSPGKKNRLFAGSDMRKAAPIEHA